MRLVRSVQSGPLEIRIPTLLRKSASDRLPPGCPAKTFRIVTWKLTTAPSTTRTPPLRRGGGFHPRLRAPSSRRNSRRRVEIGASFLETHAAHSLTEGLFKNDP